MLHYYCEMEKFKEFESMVYKEFTELKDIMAQHEREVSRELTLQSKTFKDSLFTKQKEITQSMSKRLESFTKISTYQTQVGAIKSEIQGILTRVDMASEDLKEIRAISDSIDAKLKEKVEHSDFIHKFNDIFREFKKYALYSEIKRVECKVGPLIDEVNQKLNKYDSDNKMNQHIISRFDEVLTNKASKFSIDQIYLNLAQYTSAESFNELKNSLNSEKDYTNQKIKDIETGVEHMKEYLKEEIKTPANITFTRPNSFDPATVETRIYTKSYSRNDDRAGQSEFSFKPTNRKFKNMPIEIQRLEINMDDKRNVVSPPKIDLSKLNRTFSPAAQADRKFFTDGPASATYPKNVKRIVI